jgi:hypothetical protein
VASMSTTRRIPSPLFPYMLPTEAFAHKITKL